jgi:glutaredoxin
MMEIEHIDGEDKGKIMLYGLSTCSWCRKTKELLTELGVGFDFIFVDYLEGNEKDDTMDEVKKWNPRCSFPTLVINNEKCIVGYKENEIKEALGL